MKFNELTKEDKKHFIDIYTTGHSRIESQEELADKFSVHPRTIRKWANRLGVALSTESIINRTGARILIYDLETSEVEARLFWTGKQYVGHRQIQNEPRIITVSWKWLGEDKVHYLTWDDENNDKELVEKFAPIYNTADAVIGINNNNFDNRWLAARALKHNVDCNPYVKSIDIQRLAKSQFRLISYSMDYMAKYLGVTHKQSHEGRIMWKLVESEDPKVRKEYLQKMVDYNIGDIVTTEEIYLRLRKFLRAQTHFGVLAGGERYGCPTCGGDNVEDLNTITTAAGTVQHVLRCNFDEQIFKLSHTNYLKLRQL